MPHPDQVAKRAQDWADLQDRSGARSGVDNDA